MASFPPGDSPLRPEQFFPAMYLQYDLEQAMRRADTVRRLSTGMAAMGRRAGCRAKPQKRPLRPMVVHARRG
jgi:hypothetical protein